MFSAGVPYVALICRATFFFFDSIENNNYGTIHITYAHFQAFLTPPPPQVSMNEEICPQFSEPGSVTPSPLKGLRNI